jgi:hypothetical protein
MFEFRPGENINSSAYHLYRRYVGAHGFCAPLSEFDLQQAVLRSGLEIFHILTWPDGQHAELKDSVLFINGNSVGMVTERSRAIIKHLCTWLRRTEGTFTDCVETEEAVTDAFHALCQSGARVASSAYTDADWGLAARDGAIGGVLVGLSDGPPPDRTTVETRLRLLRAPKPPPAPIPTVEAHVKHWLPEGAECHSVCPSCGERHAVYLYEEPTRSFEPDCGGIDYKISLRGTQLPGVNSASEWCLGADPDAYMKTQFPHAWAAAKLK